MATSTLAQIRKKVRRLTASPNESQLSNDDLDEYIDTFYEQDLPSYLKTWNLKSTYEFWTNANQDEYAFPLNTYHSVENPVYVGGYQAKLSLDRNNFFGNWPLVETSNTSATGTGGAAYSFTLSATPVLAKSVTISMTDGTGTNRVIADDGDGNLVDAGTTTNRGTINYVTGAVSVTFPTAVPSGNVITSRFNRYAASRPTDVLFFKNQLVLRPVPDATYKVSIEVYQRPSQLLSSGNHDPGNEPDVNQWWQFIAFGAAIKVLQDRQDMESVQNIIPFFEEQKELVLHRTLTQQGRKRVTTMYEGQTEAGYQQTNGVYF